MKLRIAAALRVILLCAATTASAAAEKHSGYADASPETRAMQDDDNANPAFLWVRDGEAQWSAPAGPDHKSCASCHGDPPTSMRGVATRYPTYDPALGRPITLEQRINQCRVERQHGAALVPESDGSLALNAYVGLQSRGLPIHVSIDGPARSFFEAGQTLFNTKMGQFNLSCAQCHDQRAGEKLAGATIPQGHPNGYPEYRLEWQTMGSLNRRVRNCMIGVRAEPFPPDSREMVDLALFLAARAEGLKIETPAVRP